MADLFRRLEVNEETYAEDLFCLLRVSVAAPPGAATIRGSAIYFFITLSVRRSDHAVQVHHAFVAQRGFYVAVQVFATDQADLQPNLVGFF